MGFWAGYKRMFGPEGAARSRARYARDRHDREVYPKTVVKRSWLGIAKKVRRGRKRPKGRFI
jgi:hypothetical protein